MGPNRKTQRYSIPRQSSHEPASMAINYWITQLICQWINESQMIDSWINELMVNCSWFNAHGSEPRQAVPLFLLAIAPQAMIHVNPCRLINWLVNMPINNSTIIDSLLDWPMVTCSWLEAHGCDSKQATPLLLGLGSGTGGEYKPRWGIGRILKGVQEERHRGH